MTKAKITNIIINSFIGILFLIFFISLGLAIAIYCRPLYYMGIDRISEETGFSQDIIKENYDALIDYCSPFFEGELQFPTLPASESGISHFEEVKVIFNLFFYMLFFTPVLLSILIFIQHKRKVSSYLLTSPIIMCVLPLIVGIYCAIDFNRIFILFHEIVFNNDDWIFNYITDPIILFLPERFFMQCAIIIVITVLIGCVILLAFYKKTKSRLRNQFQSA